MFLIVVVISVAAIDSLNPSTVLPALLFALGRHAARDVAAFTAGVFAVSAIGGLVLVFGPGRALLGLVSHPSHHVVHIIEVLAGAALLGVALFLWITREQVRARLGQERRRAGGGSAFLIGAGIMATELPTALPYFGVLIAITEGTQGNLASFTLVIVYNLVFVAPLLAVLAVVLVAGERGALWAARMRQRLIRYAPTVLPILVAVLGIALIAAAFVT